MELATDSQKDDSKGLGSAAPIQPEESEEGCPVSALNSNRYFSRCIESTVAQAQNECRFLKIFEPPSETPIAA
jgi:hypothetical protein